MESPALTSHSQKPLLFSTPPLTVCSSWSKGRIKPAALTQHPSMSACWKWYQFVCNAHFVFLDSFFLFTIHSHSDRLNQDLLSLKLSFDLLHLPRPLSSRVCAQSPGLRLHVGRSRSVVCTLARQNFSQMKPSGFIGNHTDLWVGWAPLTIWCRFVCLTSMQLFSHYSASIKDHCP